MRKELLITVLALISSTGVIHAAEAPPKRELLQPPRLEIASPLTDYFAVRGTYWAAGLETFLRLDSSAGAPGTSLSGEDDLTLNDRLDQGTFEMILRMRERSRLRVDYAKLDRHGDTTLAQPIFFGDDTYLISDSVLSDVNWRMLGLTYTYSFLKFEKFELGAGLGLHLIQAEAIGEVPARRLRQDFTAAGPFPTLALDGSWRVSKRFSLNARVQYFSAGIDELDGLLKIWHADVQYRWFRNLAVGVGYGALGVHVESSDRDFPGDFSLSAKGPEAFLRMSF